MKQGKPNDVSTVTMDTGKEDEALKELEQVKSLMQNKEGKEVIIKLESIMHNYLIDKFGGNEGIEIIPFIDTIRDIISTDKILLKKLFAVCAEVKYAGHTYESDKIQSLLNAAIEFIKSRKAT